MSQGDLKQQLSQPTFLEEAHRLFCIKPFINRGQQELGWSCRDHALTLGMVAVMLGHRIELVTGQATFVQGPASGRSPIGIEQNAHFWFRSATDGSFDACWRLDKVRNLPQWRPWNVNGIFGGKVDPAGAASFVSTRDAGTFSHTVAVATHQADQRAAVYLARQAEPLTAELVGRQYAWVNSPLTDRVRKVGPGLYSAAAMHLFDLINGGDLLQANDQDELWKEVFSRYPDALTRTIQKMQLGETGAGIA